MDFIFRFLRWKAANAVWNAGARAIKRPRPAVTEERRDFIDGVGAMLLTLAMVAIFVVLMATFA